MLQKIRRYILLCKNSTYRKIYFSKLFDAEFYLNHYPLIAESGIDPLLHYCTYGWQEERRPSLLFDNLNYLRSYSGMRELKADPLTHYLDKGWRQGKDPNRLFQTSYYLERYGDQIPANTNPFIHYLNKGWRMGFFPSILFIELKYKKKFVEIRLQGKDPLLYFLRQIEAFRKKPPIYFDASWYKDRTPVLSAKPLELWQHYLDYGVYEGKSPLPLFDPHYYAVQNNDISLLFVDPFRHYREKDQTDNRRPSAWFDPKVYKDNHVDAETESISSLEHYLKKGVYDKTYVDQRVIDLPAKPVVSIVVPVYNAKAHHLNNCIRSVLYQAYPHWELCLCDDGSTDVHVRNILTAWAEKDERIQVAWHQNNQGISAATNSAAALATGEYLGFLDNDDELTVDCLYHIVKCINETGADLLYTDEDLIGDDGRRFSTFYKPGYNRELLLCHNYITHFVVTLHDLFFKTGGCDPRLDGAQDFDLLLRLTEHAQMVVHVPEVVYHWRASETSTSVNHLQKSYADEAGRKAVTQALQRCGIAGEVHATDWKFYYRPVRFLEGHPHVTLIVYLEDVENETLVHIHSLCRTTSYASFDVLLVGSAVDSQVKEYITDIQDDLDNLSFFLPTEDFSRGELLNMAAEFAEGDYLLFISSKIRPQGDDWIEALLEYGIDPEVGLTGGRVVTPGEKEEKLTIPEINSDSPLYYKRFLLLSSIHMNGLHWAQEVMAVDLQMCLIRKKLFLAMGGVNVQLFPSFMGGVDLAYRLREKGFINIYTPYSIAEEDNTVLSDKSALKAELLTNERNEFQRNWRLWLEGGDPYYNPGCYRGSGIRDDDFRIWYAGKESR
jgi:glycosyltransferase involved in cell wall biosynthesis